MNNNSNYIISWVSFYKKTISNDIPSSIEYIEMDYKNPFLAFRNLKKLLIKSQFKIVHLHYIGKFSYLLLFLKINKLIVSPWGSDIKLIKNFSIKQIIVKRILNKSSLITVDAEFMKDKIYKLISREKIIRRINFGTDSKLFHFHSRDKFSNTLKIISLRNLEKIYSLETLIKAAKILNVNKSFEFKIDIFGEGSQKNYLKSMIESMNLNSFINLKGRFIYEDLPNILSNYNLYVSTSTSDAGIAASTSEAMSTGLIPIIANNSENDFWISNNSGLLFETSSEEDLAAKILEFYFLSSKIKREMSINARNKILNYNSYENEMNKMLVLYNETL
tara:strand:- start:6927 stop:7925 length:999 start_codon:yes stop_codon:yes gene_type:complete